MGATVLMFVSLFMFVTSQTTDDTIVMTTASVGCHVNCECNQTHLVCSDVGLKTFPTPIQTSVTTLLLNSNRISTIDVEVVSGLNQLTTININQNQFSTLELVLPPSVQTLSASGNRIKRVNLTSTTGEPLQLKEINLSENKLTSIPVLPSSVEILEMELNRIETLNREQLSPLVNLKVFRVTSSQIKTINDDAFDDIINIEIFDISLNSYTEIYRKWFENKPNLIEVKVRTFQLNCDCELVSVYDYLIGRDLEVDDLPQVTCATPKPLIGYPVENVVQNNNITGCKPDMPMVFREVPQGGVIFGVIIGVLAICGLLGLTVWSISKHCEGYSSL
uniref:Immunoglobulin superfamily containing leucine-rich repeat protein 2-like n=2 Tax=Ciona intestinalis TaxID=7719 RepID=F6XAK3_CIOIN